MNAHVEDQEGARLRGILPEWRAEARTQSTAQLRAVSPASVMVYCRATLEAYLARHYRVTEEQAARWLRRFIEEKRYPEERSGGGFRDQLARSLHRFIGQQLAPRRQARNALAQRDLGGPAALATSLGGSRAAREFSVAWARGVLTECLRRMKRYCQASNQLLVWQVFENRVLQPMLHHVEPLAYAEFVHRFGLRSPSEATRVLLMGRQMFGQFLRSVVADYAETGPQVEVEIGELKGLLNRVS